MGPAWGTGAGPALAMLQRPLHPQSRRHGSQGTSCSSAVCKVDALKFLKSQSLHLGSFQRMQGVKDPGDVCPQCWDLDSQFHTCVCPHGKQG